MQALIDALDEFDGDADLEAGEAEEDVGADGVGKEPDAAAVWPAGFTTSGQPGCAGGRLAINC